MANLDTLAILTGQKSISDMSDDELRDHIRQIRHSRLTPAAVSGESKAKKSPTASTKRTTKSPVDALLRSLTPDELAVMIAMLDEGGKNAGQDE